MPLSYYNLLLESQGEASNPEQWSSDPISRVIINRMYGWKLVLRMDVPNENKATFYFIHILTFSIY